MIVITGATGALGRQIVAQLLDRRNADQIGVSVRDPAKAQALSQRGVRVRQGDFDHPETLAAAFEGATQVLIVSSNARAYGGDAIGQQRAAVEAARAAGARRIVYTSHMGAGADSAFPPMHDHAAAEAMLRDCGVAWTALRNGFYASTVPMMVGEAASSGVLAAPADGKVSWTAHADLAAAAVEVLLQEGRFEGPTPPLTGSPGAGPRRYCGSPRRTPWKAHPAGGHRRRGARGRHGRARRPARGHRDHHGPVPRRARRRVRRRRPDTRQPPRPPADAPARGAGQRVRSGPGPAMTDADQVTATAGRLSAPVLC